MAYHAGCFRGITVNATESIGHVTDLRSNEDKQSLPTNSIVFCVAKVEVGSGRPAVFRDSSLTSK